MELRKSKKQTFGEMPPNTTCLFPIFFLHFSKGFTTGASTSQWHPTSNKKINVPISLFNWCSSPSSKIPGAFLILLASQIKNVPPRRHKIAILFTQFNVPSFWPPKMDQSPSKNVRKTLP